jgi:3-deoxy-D-manno-octulosonic acid (KDO) 8-phosphate synthase
MNYFQLLFFVLISIDMYSQNYENSNIQNNIMNNPPQIIQSAYSNVYQSNENPIAQNQIIIDNVEQSNKSFELEYEFKSSYNKDSHVSSRNVSGYSASSNNKVNRKIFHKKLNRFNRNVYAKIFSHKKSKHVVDVCFNWSR